MSNAARCSAFRSSSESASRRSGAVDELALDDGQLLVVLRVPDHDLEHEAVDLRLGQRIRALRLDRVLRRHDEEGIRNRERVVADRHLPLLHHLEERGLDLRGRAVDLVREEEVAEDRAELGVERSVARPVDPSPHEVGGDEVGRELHARERPAEHAGRRLDRQRLGEPGNALDQQMPLRQQADEHPLQHRVLPGDDAADLEERLLELLLRLRRRRTAASSGCSVTCDSSLAALGTYTKADEGEFGVRLARERLLRWKIRAQERWTPIVIEPR